MLPFGHTECSLPSCSGILPPGPQDGQTPATHQQQWRAAGAANLRKACWQVKLFFTCIHRESRTIYFYGTSENALRGPIWIAASHHLLLAIVGMATRLVVQNVRNPSAPELQSVVGASYGYDPYAQFEIPAMAVQQAPTDSLRLTLGQA